MPFLLAFGLALVLTPLAGRLGMATGLVDRPGGDGLKIHRHSVPVLGGLAVVGGALGAQGALGEWLPWTVTASTLAALGAGLVDDARPLPALIRVVLISGSGAILLAGGTGLEGAGPAGAAALILLVLVCANAVNIVDGQDGLASGLAAISSLGLVGVAALAEDSEPVGLAVALAGALAGFLVWNRPPAARVFLGNGGAYATGTLLAVLAARATAIGGVRGLLAAGICLGPFAFEVAFTLARRARAKERLARGDRLHSYDLLADATGRTASTLTFWVLGALSAGLGLVVAVVPLLVGALVVALGAVAAAWWGVALWLRRGVRKRGEKLYGGGGMARGEPGRTLE